MPVTYQEDRAILSGVCSVEEAEDLLAWLVKHPQGEVDLSGAAHLHAAVLQALMALAPRRVRLPTDEFVAACLSCLSPPAGPA